MKDSVNPYAAWLSSGDNAWQMTAATLVGLMSIPALAVLDPHGKLLYAQDQGQFEDARHMEYESFKAFFEQWKPKG